MASLYIKKKDGSTLIKEDVVDAGIANDFLVVRYSDGVVTFDDTENIDSVQFDPTADAEEDSGESTDDTPSQ